MLDEWLAITWRIITIETKLEEDVLDNQAVNVVYVVPTLLMIILCTTPKASRIVGAIALNITGLFCRLQYLYCIEDSVQCCAIVEASVCSPPKLPFKTSPTSSSDMSFKILHRQITIFGELLMFFPLTPNWNILGLHMVHKNLIE